MISLIDVLKDVGYVGSRYSLKYDPQQARNSEASLAMVALVFQVQAWQVRPRKWYASRVRPVDQKPMPSLGLASLILQELEVNLRLLFLSCPVPWPKKV